MLFRSGLTMEDSRPQDLVHNGELPKLAKDPVAYLIEYNDGLQAAMLLINGAVGDVTFAARVQGLSQIQSTQFMLTPRTNVTYSAHLAAGAEYMIQTGKAPYPVERTQIVSGMLDMCLESRLQGHKRLETPNLNICYTPPTRDLSG